MPQGTTTTDRQTKKEGYETNIIERVRERQRVATKDSGISHPNNSKATGTPKKGNRCQCHYYERFELTRGTTLHRKKKKTHKLHSRRDA